MECKAGKEEHVMVLYICLFIEMVINQELTQTLHISKLAPHSIHMHLSTKNCRCQWN